MAILPFSNIGGDSQCPDTDSLIPKAELANTMRAHVVERSWVECPKPVLRYEEPEPQVIPAPEANHLVRDHGGLLTSTASLECKYQMVVQAVVSAV